MTKKNEIWVILTKKKKEIWVIKHEIRIYQGISSFITVFKKKTICFEPFDFCSEFWCDAPFKFFKGKKKEQSQFCKFTTVHIITENPLPYKCFCKKNRLFSHYIILLIILNGKPLAKFTLLIHFLYPNYTKLRYILVSLIFKNISCLTIMYFKNVLKKYVHTS